jgi:hypothetical protein
MVNLSDIFQQETSNSVVMIRKVKVLQGTAREEAEKMGLKEDDMILLKTTILRNSLPKYHLEKIEGDPLKYIQNKYLKKV